MIVSGIGKRYAVALFNVATKEDVEEQVSGDIVSFANLYAAETGFRNFLASPMVLTEDKKDLVHKVIGERVSGLFFKFVNLLIDKKRLGEIKEITDAYTFLYEQSRGIVEVNAITAIPMGHDLERKTREALEGKIGKEIRLMTKTDPDIIGGMILFMQDKIIDGSIRYRLARARKMLSELKVY